MTNKETVVGIDKAASYLGISVMTIHRLLKRGEFPSPLEEKKGLKKVIRIWQQKDLAEFKETVRKQGERKADKKALFLAKMVNELEQENRELRTKTVSLLPENLLSSILASMEYKDLLAFTHQLATHLGMKLVAEETKEDKTAQKRAIPPTPKEAIDWTSFRETVKEEAKKQGGNRALARLVGISESIIRRFLNGDCKTLSTENVEKIRQWLQKGGS
jgi:hypothetical protein